MQASMKSEDERPQRSDAYLESLLSGIRREEALLSRLDRDREDARVRLAALQAELARRGAGQVVPRSPFLTDAQIPQTPAEKVTLFRSLFRGRTDVFPTRFVSKKTGRPGYAPACRNKFVKGLCELPKVKCGECSNQAFLPFDDAAVVAHLKGRHVLGIYPLLEDETCWLLAVDFDKSSWREDVLAFKETCGSADLPAAVERSRSGNGAHVWFFFSAPVPARIARDMGCSLITQTMSRHHRLSMESYDRLFPSQDTMPRGGFGNLIALPLQYEARQQGNSVFLDDALQPLPDREQWAYLATMRRIDPGTVDRIAYEATRQGSVIGSTAAAASDDEDAAPWNRLPSGRRRALVITEPVPDVVRAVLSQRLFVEKAGLPSPLLDAIKRLAAFQNPEFYKKQSMRLSTALTPRVIACAEDLPQHVALPRGCQKQLDGILSERGITLKVEDRRTTGEPISVSFQGELTSVQQEAATALLAHDMGVLVMPPGMGKTVVGTYVAAKRGCSTLILVHRRPLLDQWSAQLSLFFGVEPKTIGQIGAGKRTGNGLLDVAMIQSLVRRGRVDDRVGSYGQVIVDECHHLPAVSFERVLSEVKARFVVGLTATLKRRDGHDPIVQMQLGPVRFSIDAKSRARLRPLAHRLIVRETGFKTANDDRPQTIQHLYAALASDEERNNLILDDVIQALEDKRSPILLTERKDHLEYFEARLRKFARHLVVLQGGMSAARRRTVAEQLASIPDDEERLVLATGRYIGEGFDDARLDTLFLALPVSWKGTLIQYSGRLHRLHPGKEEVRIFDYVDPQVPMLLRMFEKRLRGYRAIGYAKGEAPLGYGEVAEEAVVEYDEDVLGSLEDTDDFGSNDRRAPMMDDNDTRSERGGEARGETVANANPARRASTARPSRGTRDRYVR